MYFAALQKHLRPTDRKSFSSAGKRSAAKDEKNSSTISSASVTSLFALRGTKPGLLTRSKCENRTVVCAQMGARRMHRDQRAHLFGDDCSQRANDYRTLSRCCPSAHRHVGHHRYWVDRRHTKNHRTFFC